MGAKQEHRCPPCKHQLGSGALGEVSLALLGALLVLLGQRDRFPLSPRLPLCWQDQPGGDPRPPVDD